MQYQSFSLIVKRATIDTKYKHNYDKLALWRIQCEQNTKRVNKQDYSLGIITVSDTLNDDGQRDYRIN